MRRAAAETLGVFPEPEVYTRPLLRAFANTPEEDDHLRHALRLAIRNQLREGGSILAYNRYKGEDAEVLADICLAIPTEEAAAFLLTHIQATKPPEAKAAEYVRHASRHAGEESIPKLASYVREHFRGGCGGRNYRSSGRSRKGAHSVG